MDIKNKVSELASGQGLTIAELERKLGIANGTIGKWVRQKPSIDTLQKIADYFNVSTDYLLGRSQKKRYYDLTEKDEKDITKELEEMIADLKSTGALAYSKDTAEVDEETRRLLIISLENSLRIAKIEAKKKFTPKKFRD